MKTSIKASDMIKRLQTLIAHHGNLEVFIEYDGNHLPLSPRDILVTRTNAIGGINDKNMPPEYFVIE